jgi:alkanesulfonate monooxygenase SsuD/methylene tetrahydromethanopterin reductase-like flavin-dependent oxidoreductase (luciferase family)
VSTKKKVKFGALLPSGFRLELAAGEDARKQFLEIAETAKDLEKRGFDSCWVYDHFNPWPFVKSKNPVFEAWTLLSAISQATSKIRIGTMVTCGYYRNPALLAKMAATLDVASNGRLNFGIGAGWAKEETESYGYDFPSAGSRVTTLIESVKAIKRLWSVDGGVDYQGRIVRVNDAYFYPKPLQKPHPPIFIGGAGDRILKFAAGEADAINLDSMSLEQTSQKLSTLESFCGKSGRDYDDIEKSIHRFLFISKNEDQALNDAKRYYEMYREAGRLASNVSFEEFLRSRICGTPEQCSDQLREYRKLGVSHFIFWFPEILRRESVELFSSNVMSSIA